MPSASPGPRPRIGACGSGAASHTILRRTASGSTSPLARRDSRLGGHRSGRQRPAAGSARLARDPVSRAVSERRLRCGRALGVPALRSDPSLPLGQPGPGGRDPGPGPAPAGSRVDLGRRRSRESQRPGSSPGENPGLASIFWIKPKTPRPRPPPPAPPPARRTCGSRRRSAAARGAR